MKNRYIIFICCLVPGVLTSTNKNHFSFLFDAKGSRSSKMYFPFLQFTPSSWIVIFFQSRSNKNCSIRHFLHKKKPRRSQEYDIELLSFCRIFLGVRYLRYFTFYLLLIWKFNLLYHDEYICEKSTFYYKASILYPQRKHRAHTSTNFHVQESSVIYV